MNALPVAGSRQFDLHVLADVTDTRLVDIRYPIGVVRGPCSSG